jgi:hypothetical protein
LLPRDTRRPLLAARIASARRGAESRQSRREVLASPASIGNEPRINFGMTVIDPSLGGLFLRRFAPQPALFGFNRRLGYSSPSAMGDQDGRSAQRQTAPRHGQGSYRITTQNRPAGDKAPPTRSNTLRLVSAEQHRTRPDCRRPLIGSVEGLRFVRNPDGTSPTTRKIRVTRAVLTSWPKSSPSHSRTACKLPWRGLRKAR